jgi:cyclophilin family peptidyl-prolyl cis-trans isomerase
LSKPTDRLATHAPVQMDPLESRDLMAVIIADSVTDEVPAVSVGTPVTISLLNRYTDSAVSSVVRLNTTSGPVLIGLLSQAPNTTTNFLRYVNGGRYNNTIFHRNTDQSQSTSVGELIQGGGFTRPTTGLGGAVNAFTPISAFPQPVATFGDINLENPTGHIAYTFGMARTGVNNNSSQFFINGQDNRSIWDAAVGNPGFSVFARAFPGSYAAIDNMISTPVFGVSTFLGYSDPNPDPNQDDGVFGEMPLTNVTNSTGTPIDPLRPNQYVGINTAESVSGVFSQLTVNVSNNQFATATINNGELTITPLAAWPVGQPVTFTILATGIDGVAVQDQFTVTLQSAPPLVNGLQVRDGVTVGQLMRMNAVGVRDADSQITRVEFWRDVDGNGVLDEGVDALLASDTAAAGGWNVRVDTTGLPAGLTRFFARVVSPGVGAGNNLYAIATTQATIAPAPTVDTVTPSSANVNSTQNVTVDVEVTGVNPASGAQVQVFLDSSTNGGANTLNPWADRALGTATFNAVTNTWQLTIPASQLLTGANTLFVRVLDVFGNSSVSGSTVVTRTS